MRRLILLFVAAAGLMSAAATTRIRVACVGNSVTYGAGLADRAHEAYPTQLQRLLGDGYEVCNFGHSGATLLSRGHRPYTRLPEFRQALDYGADCVVIHLGLNDTDPRNWPNLRDDFVADYEALIDSFRQANPRCRIWICRLTPIFDRHPRFRSGTRDWHRKIQSAIEAVASGRDVGLIDLHEPLHSRPDLFPDALHPNAEGAAILARTVCSALTGDYGGLRLSPVYADSMVLQRDRPLPLRGQADAGERVTVSIGGQRLRTTAGPDGRWSVTLSPLKAGPTYTLEVSTPNRRLTFNGVVAGEVWVCSGQSNMAFPLGRCATAREDLATARRTDLRIYDMQPRWATDAVSWPAAVLDSVNRLDYFRPAAWRTSSPQTVAGVSAVAYHFGRMLADSLGVPVGLIVNAVGGSPAEAWVDRTTVEREFPDLLADWFRNDFIQPWVRERAALNVKAGQGDARRHPYQTAYLFEAGIAPLDRFPVRGVAWYQGESNAHNMEAHEQTFRLLTQSWRTYWNDPSLPFCFVQLSSLDRASWPWFRDSQRRLSASEPDCYMAVTTDVGDSLDVHPRRKREVGQRLALQALAHVYGYGAGRLVASGPMFRTVTFEGHTARVAFDHADGLRTADGGALRTFELAGSDRRFYPADAHIDRGGTVRLQAAQVAEPRYVRYGWQPFTRANLVNSAGLPASTFTTENP